MSEPQEQRRGSNSAREEKPGFFHRRSGKIVRWSGRGLVLLVLIGLAYFYFHGALGPNYHIVTPPPRTLYRSAQLSPDFLEARIKEHNIKTVVNLRGEHPGRSWYDAELATVDRLGVQFVSLKISGRRVPLRKEVLQIIDFLETRPRPMLVHCKAGADRSGLVAAIEVLLNDPDNIEGARDALSFFPYGHSGLGMYGRIDKFVDLYEQYGNSGGGLDLKAWVETIYEPSLDP